MGKYSKITVADLDRNMHFTKEQIDHMVKVVKDYGLTADGVCDYCNSESIYHFTWEFVMSCMVHHLHVVEPASKGLYPMIQD